MESTYGDRCTCATASPRTSWPPSSSRPSGAGATSSSPPSRWGGPRSCSTSCARSWTSTSSTCRCTWTALWPRGPRRSIRQHREVFDEEAWKLVDEPGGIFDFPQLHYTQSADESRALNGKRGVVIISASGMADAGRVRHHLKHNLWRPEAHVVIVGFQAQGTLGRRLLEGEKRVRIFGEEIAVKAHIDEITGLSAHADQAQLLAWASHFKPPRLTVLVHGELTGRPGVRAVAGGAAALQGGGGRAERDLRPRRQGEQGLVNPASERGRSMRAMLLETTGRATGPGGGAGARAGARAGAGEGPGLRRVPDRPARRRRRAAAPQAAAHHRASDRGVVRDARPEGMSVLPRRRASGWASPGWAGPAGTAATA